MLTLVLFLVNSNVSRWEKTLDELQDSLDEMVQKEKDTKEETDRLTQKFEGIKKEISEMKKTISDKVQSNYKLTFV